MTVQILQHPGAAVDDARNRPRLIPAGEYIALPLGHRAYLYLSARPKVCLELELVCSSDGDTTYAGTVLARTYNVARLLGENGFQVSSWASDLLREFFSCTGHVPDRLDRIPMSKLRGELLVRVRTVDRDRHGDLLPVPLQYSCVAKLVAAARPFPPSQNGKR